MKLRANVMTVGVVALAMLLPACSRDEPATKPGTATPSAVTADDEALKYRKCLRDNGIKVAEPKPGADPRGIAVEGDVAPEKIEKAQKACQQTGGGAPAGGAQQNKDEALKYAKCMRDNGYNMPDPSEAGGQEKATKIDPAEQSAFEKANAACGKRF